MLYCLCRDKLVYVAQWIARQTSNLKVAGSSPVIDFASLAQLARAIGC